MSPRATGAVSLATGYPFNVQAASIVRGRAVPRLDGKGAAPAFAGTDGMQAPVDGPAAYENYIGRWSRVVAAEFVTWLDVPANGTWRDVACGTGALTRAILNDGNPARVDACDRDGERLAYARLHNVDRRAAFYCGDAASIAAAAATYDAVVAGLAFPSIDEPARTLAEFSRVAKAGGTVAAYVWDFDGEMQLLRRFWDAAAEFEPEVEESDEERYAICSPAGLAAAWHEAGFTGVRTRAIDAPARFADFDDFWQPFLSGSSPAQNHVRSLDDGRRAALRDRLRDTLPIAADGTIALVTRAWAVRGTRPPC